MKKLLLGIFQDSLARLLPAKAFRDPVHGSVWLATVAAGLWAAAISLGLLPGVASTAWGLWGWISLTVIFTALSEALCDTYTQRQTASLRAARITFIANRIEKPDPSAPIQTRAASALSPGDFVIVRSAEIIPADGEVVAGIATVDESALTGESAPVIREATDDRSAVTTGTRVISDWIIFKVKSASGESFIDKMIEMVEGSRRKPTPTEDSIDLALAISTLFCAVLSIAVATIAYAWSRAHGVATPFGVMETLALFLCLSPTTVGALLPLIWVSGMLRLMKANVMAKNAQAVESAGNVDILLLDKTGTLTLGDRQAKEFYPLDTLSMDSFAKDAQLASLADKTPEGRSIVVLAKQKSNIRQVSTAELTFIPFSAQTRMSGVDLPHRQIRKGSPAAIEQWLKNQKTHNNTFPDSIHTQASQIAKSGGTPLVLADNLQGVLGVIALRDVIKGGLKDRFAQLRTLGIKTIMITGDNPLTAAAVAAEAGVDQFVADATPQKKLELIRQFQAQGRLVAMSGDGTNDAPALAQADVALVMNSGTQPAKEAGNLIDLDSNPTKLIEVVRIGKQNLITIGALMVFSNANDIAKYFALFPAMLSMIFPQIKPFDLVGFSSPSQALMISLIFNAAIIPALLPIAIGGVKFKPQNSHKLLRHNFIFYGITGLLTPFVVMKLLTHLL